MGGIAESRRFRAVAHFPIDHPGHVRAGARFGQQGDPKSGADKALDAPAADIVPHDIRPVARRSQLRNQEILQLRSRIALAQQKPLVPKVDPVDGVLVGERVSLRNCDHDPLAT